MLSKFQAKSFFFIIADDVRMTRRRDKLSLKSDKFHNNLFSEDKKSKSSKTVDSSMKYLNLNYITEDKLYQNKSKK